MSSVPILRLGAVKDVQRFKEHLHAIGVNIPCDRELLAGAESPLQWPLHAGDSSSPTGSPSNRWRAGTLSQTATRANIRSAAGGDSGAAARA